MDKLTDFQESIKYVGGVGCLIVCASAIISIMIMEMHLRLEATENLDKESKTEKLIGRVFQLVCVGVVIFTWNYLITHYV